MALTAQQAFVRSLALSNKYTDETVIGGGAIKGKNCTIRSIDDIPGGHRVTFLWTLDDGTEKTATMDVMNGKDGSGSAGVIDIQVVAGHLIVTMADGEIIDKGAFAGDMSTAIYDTDDSGIVDNSEKVNGYTVNANVPADVNDRVKAGVSDEVLSLFK